MQVEFQRSLTSATTAKPSAFVQTGMSNAPLLLGHKRKLIPDDAPSSNKRSNNAVADSPADYVNHVFKELGYDVSSDPSVLSVPFVKPTEEMIAQYKIETLRAIRGENVETLRKLLQDGISFDCCNRFGESIIHMACRRGNLELVRFLVKEAKVNLLLRDDYGRTVLHDACWTSEPKFDLVEFLLEEVPDFLCVKDVRGHFPFNYVRKQHWNEWSYFLKEHKSLIRPKLSTINAMLNKTNYHTTKEERDQ